MKKNNNIDKIISTRYFKLQSISGQFSLSISPKIALKTVSEAIKKKNCPEVGKSMFAFILHLRFLGDAEQGDK